jgi:hypothetical protein
MRTRTLVGVGGSLLAMTIANPVVAQSSTEPGFTTGIPLYTTKLPTGLYLDLVPDVSIRQTDPTAAHFNAIAPFLTLQTPWRVANAKILFVASPVLANFRIKGVTNVTAFYNTYVGTQANWDLGHDWGLGVRVAGWIPQGGPIAARYGTIAPRIGVTYYTGKEHFTASLERGYPIGDRGRATAPNYVNLDLTYTRTKSKFEYGVVSFLSSDTNRPILSPTKNAQAAIGPLIGYTFGKVQVQAKFTSDVYERNYGGPERRFEFNIYVPLWTPSDPNANRLPEAP